MILDYKNVSTTNFKPQCPFFLKIICITDKSIIWRLEYENQIMIKLFGGFICW